MRHTRRDFIRTTAGAAVLAGTGTALPAQAPKRSATDWVTLGRSNIKVTRLAFGTGTFGGNVQRSLGQQEFTKLVRYAYDRGIRFFETADAYRGMPEMLATALKGLPRDSYRLMTKYRRSDAADPAGTISRLRSDLGSEYVDIMLIHGVRTADWAEDSERLRDALSEAKHKTIIRAHGVSCHGLLPLRTLAGNEWLEVALLRVNHKGTRMDTARMRETDEPGDVNEVVSHAKNIHSRRIGVLGMKLVGEGRFTSREDRAAALKFVMGLGSVDAVTIGFKSTAEVDEAIENMNTALNA